MEFGLTHTFDAPAEKCWAMFSDPKSHVAKFTEMGHIGVEIVEKKKTKKQLHIVITREVAIDASPRSSSNRRTHWSAPTPGTTMATAPTGANSLSTPRESR